MTLEEIKESEWYKERPEWIKEAVEILPPIQMYKFKSTGKQCYLLSYEETENHTVEEVTVTVQKTGKGGLMEQMGLSALDTNRVFGVKLEDLEPW